MNWIKFIIWLSGIYITYYFILICWDFLRSRRIGVSNEPQQLTFVEHADPVSKTLDSIAELSPSAVISSGGVSLKQLFGLAREEAIEYTKAVSF